MTSCDNFMSRSSKLVTGFIGSVIMHLTSCSPTFFSPSVDTQNNIGEIKGKMCPGMKSFVNLIYTIRTEL